ncbi:DUF3302 domain-containing protein [Desulfocastanea catecholica]
MDGRALDYVALGILIFVCITLVYAVIGIHDIPYEMAKKRNHPHQDAIHTAGWVSLFLMHALWPFLWIWATLYRPDRGWGLNQTAATTESAGTSSPTTTAEALQERITGLEHELTMQQKESTATMTKLTERIIQLERQIGMEAEK